MEKKLLSTAIAGALAASMSFAATADTTVFGNVNVSIDSVDVDGGTDDLNMSSNTSAVGFKGSEDLGGGLKAIYKIDFQFDATERNAGGGITDRDQWVGLAGNFGKVRFGSISTSYKSHGAKIDPIYRTSLQGREHGIQSRLHRGAGEVGGRMTNHVRYDSPDFQGLGFTVDYSFDRGTTATDNDTYGIGGHYSNGPILVFADYLTSDEGGSDDAWKIGGSFKMGMLGFYAQYEGDGGLIAQAPGVAGGTAEDADVWHIAGSYTMGNTLLYAAYAQGDDTGSAAGSTEYDAWTLAADHHLSKRTDVYAGFNQVDCDSASCVTSATGSEGVPATVGAGGGEIDFFSVGVRHKF
ncbi:MAG: porin [Chitinivibrionales bacterium]|nr:porin [Chitinivibrionales bacterium]